MKAPCKKLFHFYSLWQEINIHCCKWTDTKPVLSIFKIIFKQKEKIEKINALVENTMYKHAIYNSEYNFLPQGIKMEQFFARSFHLKKYLKLFLLHGDNGTQHFMFVLKMYVQIMSLSALLCNVCVCYVYILKMSKKIKVKKKKNYPLQIQKTLDFFY
jgi:hypothetical protein